MSLLLFDMMTSPEVFDTVGGEKMESNCDAETWSMTSVAKSEMPWPLRKLTFFPTIPVSSRDR